MFSPFLGGHTVLNNAGLLNADADDDDDEEGAYIAYGAPHSAASLFDEVTEPKPAGVELLNSGEFGRLSSRKRPSSLPHRIRSRQARVQRPYRQDLAHGLVPNSNGTVVARYSANAYSGQYSADASFYYSEITFNLISTDLIIVIITDYLINVVACCRDFRIHIYDTTAPPSSKPIINTQENHQTTMKTIKTIRGVVGSWTITDSHLSPDNER